MRCLRKLLNIKWLERIRDTEVLQQAVMVSIHAMLQRCQLRWSGCMCHMADEHLAKRLLYGELKAGKCCHGGQKKCYKDTLIASLKCSGISSDTWEEAAQLCATWCSLINNGLTAYEEGSQQGDP